MLDKLKNGVTRQIVVVLVRLYLAVFCVAGALYLSCADADMEASSKALSMLRSKVKAYRLANGIRVTFYRREIGAPVFSGVLAVRVGGVDEPLGHTGISHLLEHMAFKGTRTIGTKDFSQEKPLLALQERLQQGEVSSTEQLEQIEEKLGQLWRTDEFVQLLEQRGAVDINATTDKEFTKYFESLPRNAFEFWAWLESERVLNPVFRQFFKERDVVLEERRMRYEDSPEGKLYERMLETAFTVHPYRNPVIGYRKDIESLQPSQLAAVHKQYYVGNNIALSIVGDVDPEADIRIIRKYFGRIPAGSVPNRVSVVEPHQEGEKSVKLLLDKEPILSVAYHKPVYPHKDDAPISLLGEMLTGSNTSVLYDSLVKKKKLVASVSYSEGPGYAYPNLFVFSMVPLRPYTSAYVLRAFDRGLKKFLSNGPSSKQLLIAKKAIAMEFLTDLESNLSLARNFATAHLLYDDWAAILNWYDEMLAVEVDDIKRVAETYLRSTNRTVGMVEKIS